MIVPTAAILDKEPVDVFDRLDLPVTGPPADDERSEWVLVDSSIAERLLGINYEEQRNISLTRVKLYADDMKNGRWNSQASGPIRVSSDMRVVDGQHRLRAVIESGRSVLMKIVFGGGSAKDLFDYIDNAMYRQASQFIKNRNANEIASVARMVLCVTKGTTVAMAIKGEYRSFNEGGRKVNLAPTRNEIVNYAREDIDALDEVVSNAKAINRVTGCTVSVIGFAQWCIRDISDARMLDSYVDDFAQIAPNNRTVAYTQAIMIRTVTNAKLKHVSVDKKWLFGAFAYGYESYARGKEIKTIRNDQVEKTIESYTKALQDKYAPEKETDDAG